MRFSAAGNPEDYDADEREALLQATARAVGFSSAPVGSTITITAASVSITASFPVASSAEADAHTASASAYSTPSALSAAINSQLTALGANVSTGTSGLGFAATTTATTTTSALKTSWPGGGPDKSVIIGAAVGGVGGALLLVLAFASCWCAKSKGSSKPAMLQLIEAPPVLSEGGAVWTDGRGAGVALEFQSKSNLQLQKSNESNYGQI